MLGSASVWPLSKPLEYGPFPHRNFKKQWQPTGNTVVPLGDKPSTSNVNAEVQASQIAGVINEQGDPQKHVEVDWKTVLKPNQDKKMVAKRSGSLFEAPPTPPRSLC
ncbi:hypothetical protein LIER_31725 [Lithospermum erythrorhizon]|uniref:Uncharacterized protein n=1 Tax=Lithospermum erythrorhizon TaxID=34254 RepID=A0AAV3RVL7_LITER